MTSTVSISTKMDNLIQRTNEVKVCQEHMKLIGTSLIRLRRELADTETTKNGSYSQENIVRLLQTIDEVATSCNECETDLNGISYRDLQSLLLRLHWRLAQHEANTTDDHDMKVQILSNAYQEQQLLIEKDIEKTIQQKLQPTEQGIKQTTTEQLRLLREKYTKTIESYLRACIELHKSVCIADVTSDILAKVAHTFYQLSSEDQTQLEHSRQTFELPLTRTFTQFKPDQFTSFERNEIRRLLSESEEAEISKGIWERLVSAPHMMSMLERNQKSEEKDVSEENIIRTKRWILILGDPGSGKTSFARRIVHHLAHILLFNEEYSTDYGPLRIPILIRIGEFDEMLKEQPSLTLFDYIGKHQWTGKAIVDDPSISPDDLSSALQNYIELGQALIILDGLDEISSSNQRSKMISLVENFVEIYVQIPSSASTIDNSYLTRLFDNPSKSGGNQLIITSRIVGYHAAPLGGQFAHYTIQPMNIEHMNDFVNSWFFHVHQQILNTFRFPLINQGANHSEALKKELEKEGLVNMASNSCLLSFICSVTFSQLEGAPLPTHRFCLYEQIVNSMLKSRSRKLAIPRQKLIQILSDIAIYIYKFSTSNSIYEDEIKDICFQSIKETFNKTLLSTEDIEEIERQASEYVRMIVDDVGLLTERGKALYGFRHLTFQEYFAGLKLIEIDKPKQKRFIEHGLDRDNETQVIAQALRRHLYDPRFRAPISLVFSKISSTWSQKAFDDLCYEFMKEQNESELLLPLDAYTLINCSSDLSNYPSDSILFDALDRLIIAANQHKWAVLCPFVFDQIVVALRKLQSNTISLWINNFLSQSPTHDIQTISALCHLIEGKPHEFENIKWLNQSSCSMLQSLSTLDNENNGFAIDRLLIKVAFSNHQLLPVNQATFKEFLSKEAVEPNSILVILLPLIITLYGGLKRDGQSVVFDPAHIHRESTAVTPLLIQFLSVKDRSKQERGLKKLKQECIKSFLSRIENHDVSCEAVDLCITTICFYGIEYVQDNVTIIPDALLRMTMNRLKYISMILRQFYFSGDENDRSIENETTKFIGIAIQKFQYIDSARVPFLDLLNSLRSGLARLRSSTTSILMEGKSSVHQRVTLHFPNTLREEDKLLNSLLSTDIRLFSDRNSCSLLHHFNKLFWLLEDNDEFSVQYRLDAAFEDIPRYLAFRNDEDLLSSLTFVPEHLRNLYLRLLIEKCIIINPKEFQRTERHHLYFGHILTECLMLISNASCKRLSIVASSITLLPWLRMQYLENFGSSLLWVLGTKHSHNLGTFEKKRKRPINNETGQYKNKDAKYFNDGNLSDEQQREATRSYIKQEHERLRNALTENDGRNMRLYSASVSLARICRWSEDERSLHLLKESIQGAMSITNRPARLDALCVIAFVSPLNCGQITVNTGRSLQKEIEYQLSDIYPALPLLLHAAIFIRCLPLLQNQPMIDTCLQNLFEKFGDNDQRNQQAVNEALSPYLQSAFGFPSVTIYASRSLLENNKTLHNKSSVVQKYFNIGADESLSSSVLLSNLYLVELTKDFHEFIKTDERQLLTKQFQFENSILTEAQAMMITNVLSSTDRSEQSEKLCTVFSNALNRVSLVELKARCLLESWMKWKDSNELSAFAYHAALLLVHSDLWSVEAATIVCDLLCSDNDWFRQRAEIVFRSSSDHDARTSSKLGIDVLLTLIKRRAYYRHTSVSANLTLLRLFENITLDIQSHLETFFWLERYRTHALANPEYFINQSKPWTNIYIASYFSAEIMADGWSCVNIFTLSGDLVIYMCDMISSNLFSFLEIDGDTTSSAVLKSHNQFVASVLVTLASLLHFTDDIRPLVVEALTNLFEVSNNDEIRRVVACAFGYACGRRTYKGLFEKIQIAATNESSQASDLVLAALISSYSYCISKNKIAFDQDDMDLFCGLFKHPSQDVFKAVRTGYGRVLKDKSFLFGMLGCDVIQCYHALIGSTAYLFLIDVQRDSENAITEFIEEHPALLSIFIVELYNSIRHFTEKVLPMGGIDYSLAYGYAPYVKIASLVAARMSVAFCAFINDWSDGDKLKHALFYTSKQHNFPQRAACLTILSLFGELTVELCEIFIETVHDDPYIQKNCDECLSRIRSMKDEKDVLNLLLSYLKSKSMNIRYLAGKILCHLSQSSLIPFKQISTVLNDVMLDPCSNQDLWLLAEQDDIFPNCVYYYAGPLKDVIYSLLVQHLIGDTSGRVRRNEFNAVDLDFIESETASRFASCTYEKKTIENAVSEDSPTLTRRNDSGEMPAPFDWSFLRHESD